MKNIESLFNIEVMGNDKYWYKLPVTNNKGESLLIELTKIECNTKDKNSLPVLWYKHGYMNRILESYWYVDTYVRDIEGNCYRKYDPTKINGKINFNWKFEATEENKEKFLIEIYNMFINC